VFTRSVFVCTRKRHRRTRTCRASSRSCIARGSGARSRGWSRWR
jgi:hypothetical protein